MKRLLLIFHLTVLAVFARDFEFSKARVPFSPIAKSLEWKGVVLEEKGHTLWDVSPIVGDDGKVHLFVGRWPEANVDPAWRKSSEIAHYVGDRAEGPFRFQDVALAGTGRDTWDKFAPHNPEIRKFGDTYALLYIANNDFHRPAHPKNQRIGMALSKSLDGPWKKVGGSGLILEPAADPKHWSHGSQVVNPTLIEVGGNYHLYFKSRCKGQKGLVYGVAVADRLEGPYQIVGGPLTTKGVMIEDGCAFKWRDKICLISTDNHGGVTGIRGGGVLWVSDDGLHFNPDWTQVAYDLIPAYFQGYDPARVKKIYGNAPKFERPKVLMMDGKPAWLYAPSGWNVTGGERTVIHLLRIPLAAADSPLSEVVGAGPKAAAPAGFSVMSFNILEAGGDAGNVGFPDSAFGGSRRDDIADVIRECGAEIVGLQECGPLAPILKELGPEWNGLAGGTSKYSSAVVSKFPLEPLVVSDFLISAEVNVPGAPPLVLVNVHWSPSGGKGGYGPEIVQKRLKAGTIPSDLAAFEREVILDSRMPDGPRGYRRTLEVLRPHLREGKNLILTGDFNEPSLLDWTARTAAKGMDRWPANPTGRALRFKIAWEGSRLLAEAGMHDAYRSVFPDEVAKPGITWTPRYADGLAGRRPYGEQVLDRIDRIHFSGPNLKVSDAAIVGGDPDCCELVHKGPWVSDHRGVKAVFQWIAPDGKQESKK